MDDLNHSCCRYTNCPNNPRRWRNHLAMRRRCGRDGECHRLSCQTCKARLSQRKGTSNPTGRHRQTMSWRESRSKPSREPLTEGNTEPSQDWANETGSVLREALDRGTGTTSGKAQQVRSLQIE